MPRRLPVLLLLLAAFVPAARGEGPSVRAGHVWIRQAPPGVSVLAGYFSIENLTDKPLTLTSVKSPDFGTVEMHESVSQGGTESMRQVGEVDIPALGSVEFKPGGYHVMLMQPKKNLFAGDMVSLTLAFSDGSELAILAPVRRDPPQR
ncbi:MAG TPA: copper chaperone PCu(A)C [Gammaproteobacteria bacterium]